MRRDSKRLAKKGPLIGHRVLGVTCLLTMVLSTFVDSSERAFRSAIQGAFKESFNKAQPLILEPIMDVSLTAPVEFQGNIISLLNKRMATINNTDIGSDEFTISAECSLNGMFGFASQLIA